MWFGTQEPTDTGPGTIFVPRVGSSIALLIRILARLSPENKVKKIPHNSTSRSTAPQVISWVQDCDMVLPYDSWPLLRGLFYSCLGRPF